MDNSFMIDHGNHKSAARFEVKLLSMIESEVCFGFGLVLPLNSWRELPNSAIDPLGMIKQGYIENTGRLAKKHHVTHYQYLTGPIGLHVNMCVVTVTTMASMFGF
jgi:hypothetical protein